MPKVLGKKLSSAMRAYRLGPNFPSKMRLWHWLRKMQNFALLTVPYAGDTWIVLDERDLLQRDVLVSGFYEPEVYDSLFQHAHSDEIVWDVGAHVGTFSVRAASDHRVKEVHAFEPNPQSLFSLETNSALNQRKYRIHPYALSDSSGAKTLHRMSVTNTGLSTLMKPAETPANQEVFDVSCKTSDQLIFQEGILSPTLMKIDVEGWERKVLEGSKRLLGEKAPKAIVVELECDNQGNIVDRTILYFLNDFHYEVKRILRSSGAIEARESYVALYQGGNGR